MTELQSNLREINKARRQMVTAYGILTFAVLNMFRSVSKFNAAFEKGVIEGDVIDGTATVVEES